MRKVRKAVGALLGGLTGATVTALLGALGISVEPEVAAAIALLLATFGAWLAPPNATE